MPSDLTKAIQNFLYFLLILIILIFALFLRIYHPVYSLWTDEFASYWVASASTYSETILRAERTQGMSPLYFLILRTFLTITSSHSEFVLRFISLLSSLLSVIVIFIIVKILFSKQQDDSTLPIYRDRGDKEQKIFIVSLISAGLFAMDPVQIFYANNARSYASALLSLLLSQLFFIFMFKYQHKISFRNRRYLLYGAGYIVFSVCTLYLHYLMAVIFISQTLFVFSIFLKSRKNKSKRNFCILWSICILIIVLSLFPVSSHLILLFNQKQSWNWMPVLGMKENLFAIMSILNLKIYIIPIIVILFLLPFIGKKILSRISIDKYELYFLLCWSVVPIIFFFFSTYLLNSSFICQRYLLSIFPALYIMCGYFIYFIGNILTQKFESKHKNFIYCCVILCFFSIFIYKVPLTCLRSDASFYQYIPHDWKNALRYIQMNLKNGDAILIRSGFIKENWIPHTKSLIIHSYVKCPLFSFYIRKDKFKRTIGMRQNFLSGIKENNGNYFMLHTGLPIFSLTYTYDEKLFHTYYKNLIESLKKFSRIWIIGINPPYTNYSIRNMPILLKRYTRKKIINEKKFLGVYICLME